MLFDEDVKTEVCQGCEKGCKLASSIGYIWHGFRVAQPYINGRIVTSYRDENKVIRSAQFPLPKTGELTVEEKSKAHNETLQTARKIVSLYCLSYKKR